jgi:tRNA A-37 threonylcarbamoyl transferase component Bud32
MKTLKQIQEERGEKAFKQAMQMGLKYGGFGYWKDPHTGETTYKTENDALVPVAADEGETELAGKREDPSTESPGGGLGINKLLGQLPGEPGEGILGSGQPGGEKERGWRPGPEGDNCISDEDQPTPEYPEDSFVGRTNYMKWRAGPNGDNITTIDMQRMTEETVPNKPQVYKPQNPESKKLHDHYNKNGYLQKPTMNMDPKQPGSKQLGEGIAGGASLTPDRQSVIKDGEIYKNEVDALHKLKDNPNMPNIHNVDFDEEFFESSSGKQKTSGRMAMSLAKGQEVGKIQDEMTDDQKKVMAKKNWELRADMHRSGVSHGDMHEENVFYDPETESASFIDFGMGFDSPITALAEAYKGISPGELSELFPGTTADISFTGHSPLPDEFAKIFKSNEKNLLKQMKKDGIKSHGRLLKSLLDAPSNYKIKDNDEDMALLAEKFGGDEAVMKYINMLYDGIGGQSSTPEVESPTETPRPIKNLKAPNPKLDQHNKEIKKMVANSDFDLDQDGKELGAGSYGAVRMANEKHNGNNVVIKEGEVFQNELEALKHFENEEGFPQLVNAEINRPWREVAGQMRAGNKKDENGDVETFGGRVAMEAVGDMELDEAFGVRGGLGGSINDVDDAVDKLWGLKKKLHTEGWYHGDMHDANMRWDSKEQKPAMIDFGKAMQNPMGAFYEAVGGLNGRDSVQGLVNPWNQEMAGGEGTKQRAEENLGRVRERMIEMAGIDPEKQPKKMRALDMVLRGGNPDILEDMIEEDKEDFPFLQNDDNVFELINMFYDGIGDGTSKPKSTRERMAAAFSRNFNHDD